MTLFANIPNAMPEEEADKLFAAGVSFLSNKAISFRLGGKYKHIETLINTQNDNDNQ